MYGQSDGRTDCMFVHMFIWLLTSVAYECGNNSFFSFVSWRGDCQMQHQINNNKKWKQRIWKTATTITNSNKCFQINQMCLNVAKIDNTPASNATKNTQINYFHKTVVRYKLSWIIWNSAKLSVIRKFLIDSSDKNLFEIKQKKIFDTNEKNARSFLDQAVLFLLLGGLWRPLNGWRCLLKSRQVFKRSGHIKNWPLILNIKTNSGITRMRSLGFYYTF